MRTTVAAIAIAAVLLAADGLQITGSLDALAEGGTHEPNPGRAPEKPDRHQYKLNQIPDLLVGSVVHVFTDFASDVWSDGLFSMAEARERGGLGAGNAARAGGRSVGGLAVGNDGRVAGGI